MPAQMTTPTHIPRDEAESYVKPDDMPNLSADTTVTTPSTVLPECPSDDGNSTGFKRMKILMMDRATPLVLNGSEIIGSAWDQLGGEKMVQVDYLKINIRGTQIPVPILVPTSFFGGEVANVQKWVTSQYEALTLIIEEKASLIVAERDNLPSYLRLEEINLEKAKELCRQQLAAAQVFVQCKRDHATENLEWIRQIVADTIRNQYQDWKLLSEEKTERITRFFRQMSEQAQSQAVFLPEDYVHGNVNAALKDKANMVFARVMEDQVVRRILEVGQDARMHIDQVATHLSDIRRQAYRVVDFEMISFTRDYLQQILHTACETFEPHMQGQIIQTVMIQTSMMLTVMKHRIDQLLDHTQQISGCDLTYLKELLQTVPLFDETTQAWQPSGETTDGKKD